MFYQTAYPPRIKIAPRSRNLCIMGLAVLALMQPCASCKSMQSQGNLSMKAHHSPNRNERQRQASMKILHNATLRTHKDSQARLCDPAKFYGAVFSLDGDLNGTSALQFACGGEA